MKQNLQNQAPEFSLSALRAGDRAEFARLVEEYSNRIYRLALKILNDPQDAEDVLQETFIKALRALPSFEGRSSLSTWLYRIAVNEALMLVRKRRPDSVSIEMEQDDGESETEPVEGDLLDFAVLAASKDDGIQIARGHRSNGYRWVIVRMHKRRRQFLRHAPWLFRLL